MPKKLAILFLFVISLSISSCKKGEDDPSISFRTRKNRVVGEWRISEGSLTIGTVNLTNFTRYTELYVFNQSKYSCTSTGAGITSVMSSGNYRLNLVFNKDGSFKLSEYFDSKELVASGNWDFNNGLGNEKKKECIQISIKDVSSGRTGGVNLFNQSSIDFTYKIKELRNEKIVLTAEVPIYIDVKGDEQTFYAEFTLIQ